MEQSEYLLYRIYVRIWLPSEALYALSTFETVFPIAFNLLHNDYNIPTMKDVHKNSVFKKGKDFLQIT